ncbi:hypothetical protein Vau01_113620 [Virgisporangium aurantiacum]|uniref:Uncharacterized protein n=1 Tax=Virgisporangium aurantiacum TaxID=175570 RepID=A0A8J3ZLS6_9ACTN|nr:hypothetical protein Vau01_113620 [Virgisporangium aurantiacum]
MLEPVELSGDIAGFLAERTLLDAYLTPAYPIASSLPPEVVGDRVDAYGHRSGRNGVSDAREGDTVRTFSEVRVSEGTVIA